MILLKAILSILLVLFHVFAKSQSFSYDSLIRQRLLEIQKGLDSSLFVNRFESIETPCLCIDSNDNQKAYAQRDTINSNYRIRFSKDGKIDSGVQCLSKYYSKYARFDVKFYNTKDQTLSGDVSLTYGYPANSIIQYLGFISNAEQKENAFYDQLLKSSGSFWLYPDDDKYKMKISLHTGPYNKMDTFYAYLEIVKTVYSPVDKTVYFLYFDQMSLHKGDPNNQIFLKFSSTSFHDESIYYTTLVFHALKHLNSGNKSRKEAEAIWLKSFLNNPKCPQFQFIYKMAEKMVKKGIFSLPNTEPIPAH